MLSIAIARELQLADIDIAAMVLPAKNIINTDAGDPQKVMQTMLRLGHLAPSPILRLGSGLMRYSRCKHGDFVFTQRMAIVIFMVPALFI